MSMQGSFRSRAYHQRWLVPYADFVTLLLAVFVVLFASGRNSKETARQLSKSLATALKSRPAETPKPHTAAVGRVEPPTGENAALAKLMPSLQALTSSFHAEIDAGNAKIHMEPRGIVLSLGQAILFRPGQAQIDPATYPMIDKLAGILRGLPNAVRLEGHTDNVPIRNSRFHSNWDLSSARSIAMLEVLVSRCQIPRDRLSVAAFADTAPLSSNDDPAGRAQNRRVDVVILGQ
jgi:chemotaxis protein MotB